ncbi:hypothetical protein LJC46_00875 [Desulfovibrio sp. OttesenSCG-928-G15]|nr:hypothetical protein [Desulfovibrio sp. OttesenSCG-928-G15]
MQGKPFADPTTIQKPAAGTSVKVDVHPGGVYVFGFSLDSATFDQQGEDVQVDFDDGAILSLHGFVPASVKEDFTVELEDGTQLSGRDMAEMFSFVLQDFHTDASAVGVEGMDPMPSSDGKEDDFASLIESAGAGMAPLCHSVCEISLEHPLSELPMAEIPQELVKEAQNPTLAPKGGSAAQAAGASPGVSGAADGVGAANSADAAGTANFANTAGSVAEAISAADAVESAIAPQRHPSPYSLLPRITDSSLLRIDDVLDTAPPVPRSADGIDKGAFLFEVLELGPSVCGETPLTGGTVFASFFDTQPDALSDPFLLAYLRMGSE